METTEFLINKVKENVLNPILRNYRKDISVKSGDLIVLGYDNRGNRHCESDTTYVFIAQYIDGDLYLNNTKNSLILEHKSKRVLFDNEEEFSKQIGVESADAMEWWRVPTDDEVALYDRFYKHNSIIRDINSFLEDSKNDYPREIEEYDDLLIEIKKILEETGD